MREHFRIRKLIRKYDRATGRFTINVRYATNVEITPRTIGVAEAFGLAVDEHNVHIVYDNAEFKIGPSDIVLITGESGSGKSVLLKAFEKDLDSEAGNIDKVEVDPDKPIVETVGRNLEEALELLSPVGLNDAYLFLRRYDQLSDGQRYRYRLAKLLESGKQYWVMDELCATLDRDMAKIVAFNIQKQARKTGKAVIAATTHTDLFEDLAPSVHIHKGWGKRLEVKYYPNTANEGCSITTYLKIEEGTLEDYSQLAEFHYRNPETHPVPLKIFAMKREDGELVGVIFYSWPPVNVFGRKSALGKNFTIKELNENFATISRVILHPKYRSIGLGVRLVKETLPLVGRQFVEVMAVMAKYNSFFEKAGMEKIAESHGDGSVIEALRRLEELGFRRYTMASGHANIQYLKSLPVKNLEDVKEILLEVSSGYYKRLRATGKAYVQKESFQRFLEKATIESLAKVLSRLAVLAQTKVYLLWQDPGKIIA